MGGQAVDLAGEEALERSGSDWALTSPLPSLSGRLGAAAAPAQRPGTPRSPANDCPRRP